MFFVKPVTFSSFRQQTELRLLFGCRRQQTEDLIAEEVMESVPSDKRKSVFADAKKLQVEAVKQIELVSTEVLFVSH